MLNESEPKKCERCREMITGDVYAIGRTFVIFYYCVECWEVVANEN